MGSCHCGSWLATQMGVDIAVLNRKAGNANGISMLPPGGGISSSLEYLNLFSYGLQLIRPGPPTGWKI